MTAKGDRTKATLIEAAAAVVAQQGYLQATTRAIAEQAGVSEGTIYRHFSDKRALFLAAVLDGHHEVMAWMGELPDKAGAGSLTETLTECLTRLAELRAAILPLELAMASEGEASTDQQLPTPAVITAMGGPPELLARYLAGEQRAGRVNPALDPHQMAIVMLATLFGLAASPATSSDRLPQSIAAAVDVLLGGLAVRPS